MDQSVWYSLVLVSQDVLNCSFQIRKPVIIVGALGLSFLCDAAFSNRSIQILLPGYGCLVLHGLITFALEYMRGVLSPVLSPSMTTAASTLGAAFLALPFYAFRQALVSPCVVTLSAYPHFSS